MKTKYLVEIDNWNFTSSYGFASKSQTRNFVKDNNRFIKLMTFYKIENDTVIEIEYKDLLKDNKRRVNDICL